MEKILLEALLRPTVNREVIQHRQHGFNKGKSCLSNLVVVHDLL